MGSLIQCLNKKKINPYHPVFLLCVWVGEWICEAYLFSLRFWYVIALSLRTKINLSNNSTALWVLKQSQVGVLPNNFQNQPGRTSIWLLTLSFKKSPSFKNQCLRKTIWKSYLFFFQNHHGNLQKSDFLCFEVILFLFCEITPSYNLWPCSRKKFYVTPKGAVVTDISIKSGNFDAPST